MIFDTVLTHNFLLVMIYDTAMAQLNVRNINRP